MKDYLCFFFMGVIVLDFLENSLVMAHHKKMIYHNDLERKDFGFYHTTLSQCNLMNY